MAFQTVRGFKDVLPPASERLAALEALARRELGLRGFGELRLPTLEPRELFVKSTGETTDIVEKEMFELTDAGGRSLALRPEGTPGAVRAFLQHHLSQQGARTKVFYIGSMFRAERPQAGRFREFGQIGAESLGNGHPAADAELISACAAVLDGAGLAGRYRLHVNNLGCEAPECRPAYRAALLEFLRSVEGELCETCRRRIGRNPLRALDCKADGPRLKGRAAALRPCQACQDHAGAAAGLLAAAGFGPDRWTPDPGLVRGLDYYNRLVYEFKAEGIGAQDALCGGGRYDGLVKAMGGPDTPAVGWALGVERVLAAAEAAGAAAKAPEDLVYVAVQERAPALQKEAFGLLEGLRRAGLRAEGGAFGHSLKFQLKEADRLGAAFAVIFGEREAREGACILKDMRSKDSQTTVQVSGAMQAVLQALRPAAGKAGAGSAGPGTGAGGPTAAAAGGGDAS